MVDMNNKIIYFDEKVPEYYVNGSRDFQALLRLFTIVLNSSKVEADSLLYLNDPLLISNNLLSLFQTKVGFWTNRTFTDDEIRIVCDCFCQFVREKGSRNGIVKAIEAYIHTLGISAKFDILIINKDVDGNPVYQIDIGINSEQKDYELLLEILKYVLPTGYILSIYFYDYLTIKERFLVYSDFLVSQDLNSNWNNGETSSKVRHSYYSSINQQWAEDREFIQIINDADTIQSIDLTTIGKE